MKAMIQKLQDKRGEIALRLGLLFLVATFLFVIVFDIRHAFQAIDTVKDRTNEAVLAVAAINGPRALGGLRDGEATVRNYNGSAWERIVTTEDVVATLGRSLNATVSGNSLTREGYHIDNITTTYVNSDGGNLHFVTNMDITIFLLGGENLAIDAHMEVKSTYEAKF